MLSPLAFLNLGFGEMALLAIIALLLYGSDLPEVARTWGKAYQEFRRNLNGFRSELNNVIYSEPEEDAPRKLQYYPEFQQPTDVEAESAEADGAEANGVDSSSTVPIASTPATGTKLAETDDSVSKDAHGAA
jgi:Sec-independent protein translocase protein TatA